MEPADQESAKEEEAVQLDQYQIVEDKQVVEENQAQDRPAPQIVDQEEEKQASDVPEANMPSNDY